jgi:uncharacterized protein
LATHLFGIGSDNALLRYGSFVGVVGSTMIFSLGHGINIVFPVAVVGGLATAEIFRRSGSVWPAVIVHVVLNLPTIPVMVAAGMGRSDGAEFDSVLKVNLD